MSSKNKNREQAGEETPLESQPPQVDPAEEFFRREREAYIKRTGEQVHFVYRPAEKSNRESDQQ
jgi:hypothetical protein